ncbi:ATPase type 13A2 [Beauveria brongniartii RCEF 3172]|uniref:Cation-transporting ATPase n=1 Tax=Beauveria brongniartii RCEF 3172 TaxID=1081107 RepID=A0A167FF84_9HYPO|nr:ATPase type 13A2 [Beauveria brongniartii RCEF 3172]
MNDHHPQDEEARASQPTLYRLNSNQSMSSIFEEVEMAHEELYSGPVAESLPTSVSAFSHRRHRANSTASFTYYEDQPNEDAYSQNSDEISHVDDQDQYSRRRSIGSDLDDLDFAIVDDEDSADRHYIASDDDYLMRRRSSTHSRLSVHTRLLRTDSAATAGSARQSGRNSQKVYMANEDLTIAIAGFSTSYWGLSAYILLCVMTSGIAFLVLRWLPRRYVAILGRATTLQSCDWVVIENQWGELAILDVKSQNYGRPLSSVFGASEKLLSYGLDDENDPLLDDLRTIEYRYVRFFYHPVKDRFILSSGWKDPDWTDVRLVRSGLDGDEKTMREQIFGSNLIDIEQKSVSKLLVDEVLHPFYIFQIASLVLWSMDSYYYYAACIFVMSVGSIAATLLETRATMRRLREISRFECDVRVLRNGFWKYVTSSDLVPGDVYELSDPNLSQFPSDSLLLSGDCIVNESMLTGESVPVSKLPAVDKTLREMTLSASSVSPETARHFLYCGTKIVRARRPQEDMDGDAVALALVVRTGFNTTKGALVRSMLFPKPSGFKFYRDSFRYISVMAGIALIGFTASFINFIHLKLAWHLIIVRALDLITIVVPPALPATLTIGTNFALSRLKRKQIFCISPQRVNVGGKLDIMCFDKTGTLTEDGLDVLGVRVVSEETGAFGDVLRESSSFGSMSATAEMHPSPIQAAMYTMATCHSLRSVDEELVGDPLDLKMFEFTNWSFEEGTQSTGDGEDDESGLFPSTAKPPDGQFELGVLKSFEFVSQLRRASVVVRQFGKKSGDIFVKGAPEAMREICDPESFPINYEELLSQYTHKGYRVIGCATRHLRKLSWIKVQKMTREDVESDLRFVGFIIFENKLKPSTAPVVKELIESNIRAVMVTGDNILTAISVARECGLLEKHAHCFVPRFVEGDFQDPTAKLQWESIDGSAYSLDTSTLLPKPVLPEADFSLPYDISNLRNYSLAVSGDVFRWVVDYAHPLVLRRMLVLGGVFARMSPDEKHELVEKLQSIDYTCGFCGDGANDCGALKAADVGISLSEAEASVAAPFTSRVFDIRCVLEVIREGRAALVTSFSCFKYMSLYSAIQFTSVSFLYAKASNLGDFQFLFIDLLLILPIAIFMGWAGPARTLYMKRPISGLVSRKVLIPLLGLMAICIAVQAIAYITVREQTWYIPPVVGHDESDIKNSENTALFLTSCFEYVFSGVILNAGPPFRERTANNWPFIATVLLTLTITLFMIAGSSIWLNKLMELTKMPWEYRLFLVSLGLLYLGVAWVFERHAAIPLSRFFGKIKIAATGHRKQGKQYKQIRDGLRTDMM